MTPTAPGLVASPPPTGSLKFCGSLECVLVSGGPFLSTDLGHIHERTIQILLCFKDKFGLNFILLHLFIYLFISPPSHCSNAWWSPIWYQKRPVLRLKPQNSDEIQYIFLFFIVFTFQAAFYLWHVILLFWEWHKFSFYSEWVQVGKGSWFGKKQTNKHLTRSRRSGSST